MQRPNQPSVPSPLSVHLSRLPLEKPVHYYSQQGERSWKSRHIDLPCRKHLWKQFPWFFFPPSVCLPKGFDQLLFDLYKWNKWNFGGQVCFRTHKNGANKLRKVFFFFNCLVKVGFFSNNNKKAPCSHNNKKYDSIYSVQTWCVDWDAKHSDQLGNPQ